MKSIKFLSFGAALVAVVVAITLLRRETGSTGGRGPASFVAVNASKAEVGKFPVKIVCAGPATVDGVFQFSSLPGDLNMVFDAQGLTQISGTAQISLRGRGDLPEFEGPLAVAGTRSPDGRKYNLQTNYKGDVYSFELTKDGEGRAVRRGPAGTSEMKAVYSSHCMDEL